MKLFRFYDSKFEIRTTEFLEVGLNPGDFDFWVFLESNRINLYQISNTASIFLLDYDGDEIVERQGNKY